MAQFCQQNDGYRYEVYVARNFLEWDVGHGGTSQGMEVEVREEPSFPQRDPTALLANNTPAYPIGG